MSTPHLAMKFSSSLGDIITIHVDQKPAHECYVASLKVEPIISNQAEKVIRERIPKRSHLVASTELDSRIDDIRVEPREDTCPVPVMEDNCTTKRGTSLLKKDAEKVV